MSESREIYCCGCEADVQARLTDGAEVYPHRMDLLEMPFWKCDACRNFVGCHHKTKDRTRPLGCIPTPEIKNARKHIHRILDPLWRSGQIERKELYERLSERLGREYHTAEIRSIAEARFVWRAVRRIEASLTRTERVMSNCRRLSRELLDKVG